MCLEENSSSSHKDEKMGRFTVPEEMRLGWGAEWLRRGIVGLVTEV